MCQRSEPFNEIFGKENPVFKNMEVPVAKSIEQTCGVCFEVVMEKANGERRFGILSNCNHCFCLSCIMKWRQARQFERKIIKACPECRVTSDFVCPSTYWVNTKEDKDKLIDNYKRTISKKDCKYFKKGAGYCPFGNKCFYLHALEDGSKCDVGAPSKRNIDLAEHSTGSLVIEEEFDDLDWTSGDSWMDEVDAFEFIETSDDSYSYSDYDFEGDYDFDDDYENIF